MPSHRSTTALAAAGLAALALALSAPAAASEIKGAAILDHACGKLAVKHMGLIHAGKFEEAMALGSPELQQQWKALSAEDRKMMTGMMKEMSSTEAEFTASIKAAGVLAVDGDKATLTVTEEHKDENGTSTSTHTERFAIKGTSCVITD
jgi:hypothetical protein